MDKFKNRLKIVLVAFAFLTLAGCNQKQEKEDTPWFDWMEDVGAVSFPEVGEKVYNVEDYGAEGDAVKMNTEAIQATIDDCAANGGGTVTFDPGIYLTGSVFIKSGVVFDIPKGTQIIGSQDIDDYKLIDTRVAGIEMEWPAALINIIDAKDAAIAGDGVIHGRGKPFWDKYWEMREDYEERGLRWIVDYDVKRPRGVLVQDCENVTLKDFVLYQAGFWSVHILYSSHVTVDGLVISNNIEGRGPSTDGIDIDSSTKILVQNCTIHCNDDNICLKAGRDADGLRVNKPTEYVVIRDCVGGVGHGLFTCGSETSGGIRNIVAYNLKGIGTSYGIRFKSAYSRGGVVEDIYLSNIEMEGVGRPFYLQMNWNPSYSYSQLPEQYDIDEVPEHWRTMLQEVDPEKAMPEFRNIHLKNIKATGANTAIAINGHEDSKVTGFTLENVSIQAKKGGSVNHAANWEISNVSINADSKIEIANSTGVAF